MVKSGLLWVWERVREWMLERVMKVMIWLAMTLICLGRNKDL